MSTWSGSMLPMGTFLPVQSREDVTQRMSPTTSGDTATWGTPWWARYTLVSRCCTCLMADAPTPRTNTRFWSSTNLLTGSMAPRAELSVVFIRTLLAIFSYDYFVNKDIFICQDDRCSRSQIRMHVLSSPFP